MIRFKGTVLKKLVGSMGLELDTDHEDCKMGAVLHLPPNGRYIIQGRQLDEKGHLHLTLVRDTTTRKARRARN